MENIIEYVNVPWYPSSLESIYNNTLENWDGRGYIECGAKSHILSENLEFESKWKDILNLHKQVHNKLCPLATGFNFNETEEHTVPPHIDVDTPLYFNLLLPVFGVAKINIYETNPDHLEFRHGMTHWKMVQDDKPKNKIGEFIVDKPTLLNTDVLHEVQPLQTPRCVWCTRWINVPRTYTFKTFKKHLENTLNG